MNKKIITIIAVFIMVYTNLFAITIKGKISNKDDNPVSFANVFLKKSTDGSITDNNGYFTFSTKLSGIKTLVISHIQYEKIEKEIVLSGDITNLNFILVRAFVEMDEITVSASSFSAADEEGKTLNSMDVYTTAGAEADVLKTIQTFPGVSQIDESAGLFVRGGDVSETKMYLDGATLSHPYKYETDQGGYFGMMSPWHLKGTYFSSGAFSAKYGNALSGVLAMESLDRPAYRSLEFGVGLAAISLGFNSPVNDKLGVRFSGNYSDCKALFKLNGTDDQFEQYPVSYDMNLNLTYNISKKMKVKYFIYGTQDEIQAEFQSPTFQGFIDNKNNNFLNNLQLTTMFSEKVSMKTSVSMNKFYKNFSLGGMEINTKDYDQKIRSDFVYKWSKNLSLNYGFEINKTDYEINGKYSIVNNDLSEDGNYQEYNHKLEMLYRGFYLESKYYFSRKLMALMGIRMDDSDYNEKTIIDPRISFVYQLNNTHSIKLASGIYHQFPKSQFIDGNYGGSKLSPMKSEHYVLGYELKNESMNFKSEFYYKDYDDLPLEIDNHLYNSGGYGYVYGGDFFLKGTLPFISGWISYSYLKTERKQLEYQELIPGDYDIRHNFVAALKKYFSSGQSYSLTYKIHTGRPYTGALNQWNQKRLPPIQSLDLSWSYYQSFKGNNFIVYYISLANILDSKNTYGYYYSPDYSERTAITSTFGRSIYFGFTMSLGKLPSIL